MSPTLARIAWLIVSLSVITTGLQGCGGGAKTQTQPPPAGGGTSDTTAPTQPTNLTATATLPTRVELSWSASSDTNGIASYQVFRDGSQTVLASVTATTHSDTTVTANTTYAYTVRAVDPAGNVSVAAATATVTTPPAATSTPVGLDSRPSTQCTAWPRTTTENATISLERYTSLSFNSPIAMLQAPGNASHWYIVQQNGVVRRFAVANPTSAQTVIDLQGPVVDGGERGLLGMAFHPNFPTDPRVFLSYTTGNPLVSRVSSFTSTDQGATLQPGSEVPLLTIDQPEDNHNGGHIAFGPDGYLYIGIGDGGGGGDNHGAIGNGQRLTTMLGKMLRINVNGAAPYAIPASNPFAANATCPAGGRSTDACPEIYAYGLRNPWRWSFDRERGDLWVADVGQGAYEEVNQVTLGGNYGWRCREGAHNFNTSGTPGCSSATLIDPVAEYGRDLGRSITGGYVYRGTQATGLLGHFIFGDFASGRIFAWGAQTATSLVPIVLLESGLQISSFGEANDGELFVVHYSGTLHRIVFSTSGTPRPAPNLLSETGCVQSDDPARPAAGMVPYSINAPFWSDSADKERWLALPNNRNAVATADGDWDLPNGTVLLKHFRTGSRLIETRLLMRHPDGEWGGFTYEWNSQQTNATLVTGGAERELGLAEPWIFPSEVQCLECHTSAAGRSLGLESAQLNRNQLYPSTNRTANQLVTLSHVGMLTPAISDPTTQPALADPADTSAPLAQRARAYLHTNCAFCHRPNGPTPSTIDLRHATTFAATNTCNAMPTVDVGIGASARIVAPGSAGNSVLVNRMNRRDEHAMPPLGSNQVDTAGVELISAWINGLTACP